jgi:hypothetical protein
MKLQYHPPEPRDASIAAGQQWTVWPLVTWQPQ